MCDSRKRECFCEGNKKARKRGNLLRKEQERAECKEDFSTAFEMTVGKAADSMNLRF